MSNRIVRGLAATALVAAGTLGVSTANAAGLGLAVDTVSDVGDATPGDGVCDIGTGDCSLRAAIEEANAFSSDEPNEITFSLPAGPAVITVGQPLPTISTPTSILGATQPGAQPLPRISIVGVGASGLSIAASDVTVDAISLSGFDAGIEVTAGENVLLTSNVLSGNVDGVRLIGPPIDPHGTPLSVTIFGDRIGTDASGTSAVPNTGDGVHVRGLVSFTIGDDQIAHRNVISGNGDDGIDARGSWGAQSIEGARIGTNIEGEAKIPNGGWGVDTDVTQVGRYANGVWSLPIVSCSGACNVISGNRAGGIRADTGGVSGNVIGLNATATAALANRNVGVTMTGNGWISNNVVSGNAIAGIRSVHGVVFQNFVGTDGSGTNAVPNGNGSAAAGGVVVLGGRVGYGIPDTGNVISGNDGPGVVVTGDAFRSGVTGNLIGLDATGTEAIGNTVGVMLKGRSSETAVGASLPSQDENYIAGNIGAGIVVGGSGGSHIRFNQIGVGVDGSVIGNGDHGVMLTSNGNDLRGNRIVGSGAAAVAVVGASENAIVRNTFEGNAGVSIDLGDDGPTPDDPGDLDEGANHLLNAPTIDEVDTFGDRTLVHYHVDPAPEGGPNVSTLVEFFADDACPASGLGQGSDFLVEGHTRLDGTGVAELPGPFAAGVVISATRTEGAEFADPPERNTSEFSPCATPLVHPADITAPEITIAWPQDGASLTAGLQGTLNFDCDDGVGSGVVLCSAGVNGAGPFESGTSWLFGDTPDVTMTVRAVDLLGNEATESVRVSVENGTASDEGGGFVSTDPSGIGATSIAPIQTELSNYGSDPVEITTPQRTSKPPVPFLFLDREVHLVAPDSPVWSPQVLKFRVDPSVWDRAADAIRLFHDGVLVPRCQVAFDVADPDPCSTRGIRLIDGDVQVRVNAMSPAGIWNIAWRVPPFDFSFVEPTGGPPVVNVARADRPIPMWFTLGGNQGSKIFAERPSWKPVLCWTGAPEQHIPGSFDSRLSYDPITDTYQYVEAHPVDWAGTCRVVQLRFVDGTDVRARYRFR